MSNTEGSSLECDLIKENEKSIDPAQSADEEEMRIAVRKFCDEIFAKNGTSDVQKGWYVRKNIYMCDICYKILFKRRSWLYHMELHKKEKKYSCTHCERKFDNEEMLETHLKSHAFFCERCPKIFTTAIELGQHYNVCYNNCLGSKERVSDGAAGGNGLESSSTSVNEKAGSGVEEVGREIPKEAEPAEKSFSAIQTAIIEDAEGDETSVTSKLSNRVGKIREYECQFCGKHFKKKSILDLHITNWHKNRKKTFKCKICFKELSASRSLRNHMSAKHGIQISRERKFQCERCRKLFTCQARLQIHCDSASHWLAPNETASSSNLNVDPEMKTNVKFNVDVPHQLEFAEKSVSEVSVLSGLSNGVEKTCMHECQYCGKRFQKNGILNVHIMNWHANQKKTVECRTSNESASTFCENVVQETQTDIKVNEESSIQPEFDESPTIENRKIVEKAAVHAKNEETRRRKKFRCEICSKLLSTLQSLQYHLLRRYNSNKEVEKARRFVCKYCSNKFTSAAHVRMHSKIHNRQYGCYVRDELFADGATLQTRAEGHKKKTVDCPYCGITFTSKTELNYHIKSTGENLFICGTCLETFENYLAFKYHMLVHNREEVFICTLCDKKFVTDGELAEHIREHR